ncbi:hypothetical protein ACLOJK_025695 [Asimina triloba]
MDTDQAEPNNLAYSAPPPCSFLCSTTYCHRSSLLKTRIWGRTFRCGLKFLPRPDLLLDHWIFVVLLPQRADLLIFADMTSSIRFVARKAESFVLAFLD